jgi:hypothetical protein
LSIVTPARRASEFAGQARARQAALRDRARDEFFAACFETGCDRFQERCAGVGCKFAIGVERRGGVAAGLRHVSEAGDREKRLERPAGRWIDAVH